MLTGFKQYVQNWLPKQLYVYIHNIAHNTGLLFFNDKHTVYTYFNTSKIPIDAQFWLFSAWNYRRDLIFMKYFISKIQI